VSRLNFDTPNDFGEGVKAFTLKFNNAATTEVYRVFDASGLVFSQIPTLNGATIRVPTEPQLAGSTITRVESLNATTLFRNIKICGAIYFVEFPAGDAFERFALEQVVEASVNFFEAAIDGTVFRNEEYQPNFNRRNSHFSDGANGRNLTVEWKGDYIIDPQTMFVFQALGYGGLSPSTPIRSCVTFLVDTLQP